ncbi:MAG: sugar ABC transporter ATP-binding protein [Myxococcota bacterium]
MRGVQKRFGAVRALDGVDLSVRAGEVHALLGENGAGKSTLMKILSGALTADEGQIELDSRPWAPAGPVSARDDGIAIIYQELTLAPDLSVEANIVLGREPRRFGLVDRRRRRAVATAALAKVGADIDPGALVSTLGPGQRQRVEIARALAFDARIVVMDEPTSSLSHDDVERLFSIVAGLQENGVTVIYITHFLEEALRIGDRYTALRDGRTVATGDIAGVEEGDLIRSMVGRPIDELFPTVPHEPGPPILELENVRCAPSFAPVNLTLHQGEVLGVFGLLGAGRTELLRAIFGLARRRGVVRVGAHGPVRPSPRTSLAAGVGLLSEDRKGEGLLLDEAIELNVALSNLASVSQFSVLRRRHLRRRAEEACQRMNVRAPSVRVSVGTLSGGNQQKVALARLLYHDVDVFLLDEPTRGIDVASKADIYRWVGELAAKGKAVLFVSSYIPELLGVCDRIAVLRKGTLSAPRSRNEWSQETLLAQAALADSAMEAS